MCIMIACFTEHNHLNVRELHIRLSLTLHRLPEISWIFHMLMQETLLSSGESQSAVDVVDFTYHAYN